MYMYHTRLLVVTCYKLQLEAHHALLDHIKLHKIET